MMVRLLLITGLSLILFLGAFGNISEKAGGWQLILQDYGDGLISLDQKAQLALTLLTEPENLPERYHIDKPMKDATGMILDIMTDKDRINPDIIHRYYLVLNRVTKQKNYDTPEGHFRIHYDTTGVHVVYDVSVDVNPADGVPDYVNRTGEYFERAWTFQVDTLGYDTPPYDSTAGGGLNLYDVYMHHYSGAYGVTWPENYSNQRPYRNQDMTSYIYVDPNYNGFGYPDRTLPMKVTSAHEFFHAVQMAYNASAGSWFMENCATWMEEKMWDEINDCYFYLSYFFNNPHYSLMTANGSFEYGAFVWPTYLDEQYGDQIIKAIWEWTINTNAMNAMLAALDDYGSGIQVDYPTFALWNYLTGARSDGQHYEEASGYNQVRIMRTHTSYPVENNSSFLVPGLFGSNYILFSRAGNSGNLRIHFNGADAGIWVVPVVKSISTNQHEFDEIILDSNEDGEILIQGLENYVGVAIIPCLIYGGSANYTYSAEFDTLTGIDDDCDALPEQIVLHGNYPNPFNSSTVISFDVPDTYAGPGSINIYDQLGRIVLTKSLDFATGSNRVMIDMKEISNNASGIYYYKIKIGDKSLAGRMTYLK
jgi:hypothetical protein